MFAAVASTALAGMQAAQYQLHAAAATYREAIRMIGDPTHVLGFEAHLGLAKIVYDQNALDEAESLALLCSGLVERAKSKSEIGADLLMARLLSARNDHDAAEALVARANGLSTPGHLTDRLREAADLRVQHLLRRGSIDAAADLAGTHPLAEGLARTLLAQGKGLDALRTIEGHRHAMESEQRTQEAIKARVVEVIIHQGMGQTGNALALLREVLTQAQSQGSIRLFVDEGAPMQALLSELRQEHGTANYVAQLLGAFGTQAMQQKHVDTPTPATSSHLPLSTFSQRELDILRLIQEGHSNQHIGERLFLSLSTVKWHNQNIFAKLDVQRRTEAVARALQLKLL
jgi:LuxR family maltose regulon positive regulatory protein